MRKYIALFTSLALLGLCRAGYSADEKKGDAKVPAVLNFKMKGIDGKEVDLCNTRARLSCS